MPCGTALSPYLSGVVGSARDHGIAEDELDALSLDVVRRSVGVVCGKSA